MPRGSARKRKGDALVQAHPNEPWLWKKNWASGKIVFSDKLAVITVLVFALLWNLMSSSLFFTPMLKEIFVKGNRVALVGLIFPAVGLLLICCVILLAFRWRKYGRSTFEMASVPGVIGGQLAGVIRTALKIRPEVPSAFDSPASTV